MSHLSLDKDNYLSKRMHDNNTYTVLSKYPVNVSAEVLYYFLLVNMWGPGFGVCVFGIVTNILNIITFIKQGLKDTVSISLLGLATSDLGSQVALFFTNICFNPEIISLDLPFIVIDFMIMFAWCHIMFTRVTTWITAYITLERCLCVTVPLKVRNIFTPIRTILFIAIVYIIMIATVSLCFYTVRPVSVFDLPRNKTLLRLSYTESRQDIDNITFTMNNAIPTIAFFLVIINTAVLVSSLIKKSKWRRYASASVNAHVISDRDNKVVKIVTLISVIFITCYLPGAAIFIWLILDPELRFDGQHVNLIFVAFSVLFHLESINAGVNIFIYLAMSSKFKATFVKIFCFKTQGK